MGRQKRILNEEVKHVKTGWRGKRKREDEQEEKKVAAK